MARWWTRLVRKLKWWLFQARLRLGMGDAGRRSAPPRASSSARAPAASRATTQRRAAARPPSRWRWAKWLGGLALAGVLVGALALVALFAWYGADPALPRIESANDYHPKVVTKVVDREGELLGELYEERRTVVPRSKIPDVMVHAIVDAEDAQFFEHKGLNYYGMLRAFIYNLRPGAHLQGASTITQQIVRNLLLKSNERTLKRKVQEMILARRLDAKLSKDDVLTLYLNQIDLGHGRFGVEEAARFYFGKSISDVNAGEAAVLASLPKGPTEMDPWKHPERVKDRQRYVLSQMLRYGHLQKADADRYANAPIEVVKAPSTVGTAPEFIDEVRHQLVAKFGEKRIADLGVTVVTTCDAQLEKSARAALERHLVDLDKRAGHRKPVAHAKSVTPAAIRALLDARAAKKLADVLNRAPTHDEKTRTLASRTRALDEGRPVEAVVIEVRPSTGGKGAASREAGVLVDAGPSHGFLPLPAQKDRYNPDALPVEKRFAVGDVLVVRAEPSLGRTDDNLPLLVPAFGPQAALVVIDPATREVRALVGGYGFHPGDYDRALKAERQPGSAFKPFLYATALTSGKWTAASVLNDSPQVFELPGLAAWAPKNAESHDFLGPVRLRVALAKSLNTVASQLVCNLGGSPTGNPPCGGTAGAEALAQLAHAAGIESKLEPNLALGIGASVVTLLELTNAYTTFDAGGRRTAPLFVTRIGDEVVAHPPAQQAMTPEIAYLVTSLMESVIDEGTAAAAKPRLRRPAAGKTGTTNSERDAWFVGFTPDVVVGVWVGFDDMRDLGHGEQGARSALPIWIDVVNDAVKLWRLPPRPFTPPPGIVVARIDPATGLLAPPGAANAIDEKFLAGTAPTEVAPEQGAPANPDDFITGQAQ